MGDFLLKEGRMGASPMTAECIFSSDTSRAELQRQMEPRPGHLVQPPALGR